MAKKPHVRGPQVERRPDGTFPEGVSGNPGGMPTWLKKVRDQLQEAAPEAAAFLLAVVRGEKIAKFVTNDGETIEVVPEVRDRIAAAKEILAFVPKPKQQIEVEEKDGPSALKEMALAVLAKAAAED